MQNQTRAVKLKVASAARREQGKLELKRQILDAAVHLFETKGYEDFSLRQVAEAIGYSPTTIYLYFKDKEELLFTVAVEGFRGFGIALQAAYDSAEPIDRIWQIGRAYYDFALANSVQYRLMFMQRGEFLMRPVPAGYSGFVNSFGVVTRAVAEAMKRGEIKLHDPRETAGLLWTAVHGVVSLLLNCHIPQESGEPLFTRTQQMLRRELA